MLKIGNHKRVFISFLAFGFLLIRLTSYSQVVRTMTFRDGLPQSFVSGLVQDDDGFIWIGTRNGLVRYDGRTYKRFQQDNPNLHSIASNLILCLKYFNHKLWIEYDSGEIDVFNPETEEVRHFLKLKQISKKGLQLIRRSWFVDEHQVLWGISESGLIAGFDGVEGRLFPISGTNFHKVLPLAMTPAADPKSIWILCNSGICRFNKTNHNTTIYPQKVTTSPLSLKSPVRRSISLLMSKNGDLIWGIDKQLTRFLPKEKRFETIPIEKTKQNSGVLWINQSSEGTIIFESDGQLFTYLDNGQMNKLNYEIPKSILPVQSFLIDKSDLIWIGTNAHGIRQIHLNAIDFSAFSYRKDFGSDWLKMLGIDLKSTFNWKAENERFSPPGYHIRWVYNTSKTKLWIGLKETIICYNIADHTFQKLPLVKGIIEKNEEGIGIKGLALNQEGLPIVIGFNGNLLSFNDKTHSWKSLIPKESIRKKFGPKTQIRDLLVDAHFLWISTEQNGLLQLDLKTKTIKQIHGRSIHGSLPVSQLLSLHQDPHNTSVLWIGSYNGLIRFQKETHQMEIFTMKDGFPDNTIYGILSDNRGLIWFTSNNGLCCFDPVSKKTRVFQYRHGLPENEFNRFHHAQLPDGTLVFGGTEGGIRFHPEQITTDHFKPFVAITEIRINNKTYLPTRQKKTFPIRSLKQLRLPYDQNTISFTFAGLEFDYPEDIHYRYQLKGYDNQWIEAGNSDVATYTKLPAGTYEFIVNCSNTSGIWSPHTKRIQLTITPPVWATWWAYVLYTLVIVTAISYLLRSRQKKRDLELAMTIRNHEAEQLKALNAFKSKFFTNISHDFRTPLTLIISPVSEMITKLSGTPYEQSLKGVKRNSEQLLELINQIMDLSRIESHTMPVREVFGELTPFVEEVTARFKDVANLRQITISIDSSIDHAYFFDKGMLDRILDNLLGNAMKFTPEMGSISLTLYETAQRIQLSVTNSGNPIPERELPHLFDRYYQSGEYTSQGSGIGLSLVKELVELQGGSINVSSDKENGTIFTLNLPYRKADNSYESATLKERIQSHENQQLILLVEDNEELAAFLTDKLTEQFKIIHGINGAEGLKLALEHIPDVIISDVMMPVMDGFELCKQLQLHEETNHISTILLTAKVDYSSRMEGMHSGATDYIQKPFDISELVLKIRNILTRLKQQQERFQNQLKNPGTIQTEQTDSFQQKIYVILEKDLDNSSITVEFIANKLSMSRIQLYRKVKALTGMAVSDLVRNYRLKRAADFLSAGCSSAEAAYRSGFESPAYFSKCFRELYGKTPSEFRKSKK